MSDVRELIALAERSQTDLAPEDTFETDGVTGIWRPATVSEADWGLACLADSQARIAEIDRQVAAAIEAVKRRAAEVKAKEEKRAAFFLGAIRAYAEENRTALLGTGRAKSRELLHGRIAWRRKPGRLVVTDPAALEAWLLAQPVEAGLYRMKVEPEKRALNDLFAKTDALPPGCTYEPEREEITITAEAPETALAKE